MIDIIIPTLKKPHLKECLEALKKNTSVPYRPFLIDEGKSWPEAINIGLKKAGYKHDVVLMDDDIRVLPGWLDNIEEYKKIADIIGFKLLFPNGKIAHAGGFVTIDPIRKICGLLFKKPTYQLFSINVIGYNENDRGQYDKIKYLPHVTTSLIYIKKDVFQKIKKMSVWKGHQFEDVDFGFKALEKGFKILYTPNKAIHLLTATKKNFKDINKKAEINYLTLHKKWLQNKKFLQLLKEKKFIVFKLWKLWFMKF